MIFIRKCRDYSLCREVHLLLIHRWKQWTHPQGGCEELVRPITKVLDKSIEPWVTNAFTKKVQQGSFAVTNKYLEEYIQEYYNRSPLGSVSSSWIDEQWTSIKKNNGSVQHLDWMSQDIKDVFKTAFEIDQRWLIEFAGDRSPLVDQGQSLNIFIPGNSHVQLISDLHILAWKKKIKSLYYLRSSTTQTASTSSTERQTINTEVDLMSDTCLGCT